MGSIVFNSGRIGECIVPNKTKSEYLKVETPATYRIIVEGHLDERWLNSLTGIRINSRNRTDNTVVTTLIGPVRDQAELTGLLNSLYELHLPILSVEHLPENSQADSDQQKCKNNIKEEQP